jgi:bifunctional DNA-binding transcriptional regulator/antitoxin component of YhaV-PrlF toxin-antitoxin module
MTTTARYGTDLTLPDSVRDRYNLKTDVPVRIIETRDGILLVPLTGEPMPAELLDEIADWQALAAETWDHLPE